MSSLIFYTDQTQVFVATDTLATSLDGKPAMFTTKAFVVPHIRAVICGTGAGGFLGKWFIQVTDRMVVRGIDNLDYHAPSILAANWSRYKEEFLTLDSFTVTVYHFGFSEEDGLIHSYAYRSIKDFKSESLEYGVGIKPECTLPEKYIFPTDIKRMMDEQRRIQASRPQHERVFIGGEIQVFHLTVSGINIYTLGRFEDYDADEQAIFSNFNSQ